jgi:membrane-associated phospholipid phosphatase
LGDFHWIADGVGGLLLAFVVLVVAFAACRTYFDRRFVIEGVAEPIAHERE